MSLQIGESKNKDFSLFYFFRTIGRTKVNEIFCFQIGANFVLFFFFFFDFIKQPLDVCFKIHVI